MFAGDGCCTGLVQIVDDSAFPEDGLGTPVASFEIFVVCGEAKFMFGSICACSGQSISGPGDLARSLLLVGTGEEYRFVCEGFGVDACDCTCKRSSSSATSVSSCCARVLSSALPIVN
jgi:hypothetical protein